MAIPTLRSPTIRSGGIIPDTHTANGLGVSPALDWRRTPPGRPNLTIIVRSWASDGGDEIVHWLVYDIPAFIGGLEEDAGESQLWTIGLNSHGSASYLPFAGTNPRQARFEFYASRSPTGLDDPATWEDVSEILGQQSALGPYGFEAYDVDLPMLMGLSK